MFLQRNNDELQDFQATAKMSRSENDTHKKAAQVWCRMATFH